MTESGGDLAAGKGKAPAIPGGHAFHALDGLRGVAALTVLMWHTPHGWPAGVIPRSGYLSVDLFFVLSGFVLAHAYDPRFARGLSTRDFMLARLIRLFPLYFLACFFKAFTLLLTWAIFGRMYWPWTPAVLGWTTLLNGLFLPVPSWLAPDLPMFPLADQAWSLFFELVVNLLFALSWRRLTTPLLVAVCGASAAILVAISLKGGGLNAGMTWDTLWVGLVRVLFSFPMGVLLYRLSRGMAPVAIPAIALMFVFAFLAWLPLTGLARALYDPLVIVLVFPLLILTGARTTPGRNWAAIFGFLGATSYGVYLLHRFFSVVFDAAVERWAGHGVATFAPWSGLAFVGVMLVTAWLVDRAYDTPLRGWLTRKLLPRRA